MPTCCVPDCSNNELTQPFKTFHRFPLDPKKRQSWINRLHLRKEVTNYLRVCSDHFLKSDLYIHGAKGEGNFRTRLRSTAKPVDVLANNEDEQLAISECHPLYLRLNFMGQKVDVEHSYASDIQPESQRGIVDLEVKKPHLPTYLSLHLKKMSLEHSYASDIQLEPLREIVGPEEEKLSLPLHETFHTYCKNSYVLDLTSHLEPKTNGQVAPPSPQSYLEPAIHECQPACPSLQMTEIQPVVECQPLQMMDTLPVISESQPICSSNQITDVKPATYDFLPLDLSIQIMCRQITIEHSYATDITNLKRKYENSLLSLQTKTNEVIKLKRQRVQSFKKILNLTRELKDTKKLYDEAFNRLQSYKGIPVNLLKKPAKEYSSEQIKFASTLYCYGGKVYQFLREKINLPHPSSIRRFRPSTPKQSSFKSPVTRQFKSPLNRSETAAEACSESELQEQIVALKKALEDQESEIQELTSAGYKESELQEHIDKLHEYNEIKDVGQMLMGRIAEIEGLQTKDLYERYGLSLNA